MEHTLGADDLIIAMTAGTKLPAVRVLDGDFSIIKTLTMRTGTQCIDQVIDDSKKSQIVTQGPFYMCLPKEVNLRSSLKPS